MPGPPQLQKLFTGMTGHQRGRGEAGNILMRPNCQAELFRAFAHTFQSTEGTDYISGHETDGQKFLGGPQGHLPSP